MESFLRKNNFFLRAIPMCIIAFFGMNASTVAQTIDCPSVSITASEEFICPGECVDLSASPTEIKETSSYTSSSIAYDPFPFAGSSQVFSTAGNDEWSNAMTLPFNFCFYEGTYNQFVIGSNGLISFNMAYANATCDPVINSNYLGDANALNTIAGVYADIDPSSGGEIYFDTYGIAPCRAAVISYNNIPMVGCPQSTVTFQIVLFENTNVIEINIDNKPNCGLTNGGTAIQGVMNAAGNLNHIVNGRNYPNSWSANDDSRRISPNGASTVTTTWYDNLGNTIGTGNNVNNLCPTENTVYQVSSTYTDCTGNLAFGVSSSVLITIEDVVGPEITQVPEDVSINCDVAIPNPPNHDCVGGNTICVTDNCDTTPTVSFQETSTQTNNGTSTDFCYDITRTWTATDDANNQTTETQIITVQDTVAPVFVGAPNDTILFCVDFAPAAPGITCEPGKGICAIDNCDDNVTITMSEISTQTFTGSCSDINFTVVRTWTATDVCGNVAIHEQTIVLKCECCGNGIDDDDDGLVDGKDPECPCSNAVLDTSCDTLSYYYIPPVWQMQQSSTNQPSSLILSTSHPTATVTVRNADNSFNQTYTVNQGSPTIVALNVNQLQTPNANVAQDDRGFIIESDKLLQVFYRIDGHYNKILMTVKGENALGQAFRTGSQTKVCGTPAWTGENHFISVMAVEDNTVVDFEFVTPMWGLTGSNTHSVTLDAGETYLVRDNDQNKSITGSLVVSDKPIAVVSGSQHNRICNTYGRDGGIDQIVPTCLMSTDYVVVKSKNVAYQNYAAVVAIDNNTQVYKNGTYVTTLVNAGDFVNIDIGGTFGDPTSIKGNKPVYVYHFSGISETNGELGMAIAGPVGNCSGDTYTEFPKFAAGGQHASYVIIPTAALPSLKLNGTIYTNFATAEAVPGLAGYSTVWFDDSDLQANNILTADDNFHAALLVGINNNSGTLGYITSFKDRIEVFHPETGAPSVSYELDSILCQNEVINHCINANSCSDNFIILDVIEGPFTSKVTATGGACFEYEPLPEVNGTDNITVIIENDMGLQQPVCHEIYVCTVSPELFNIPEDVTVPCTQIPAVPNNIYATSVCFDNPQVIFSEDISVGCPYTITRSWTAVDQCGNELTVNSQIITVEDEAAPTFVNFPENEKVDCYNIPAATPPAFTDNCDVNATIELNEVNISGFCEGFYFIHRTWTITDICGNENSETQILQVVDCDPGLTELTNYNLEHCQGETATLQVSVEEGVFSNPLYTWQYSSDNGSTWANIGGVNSPMLTIPTVSTNNAGQYQLVVSSDNAGEFIENPDCDTISNVFTLDVFPTPITDLNITICAGESYSVGSSTYTQSGNYTNTLTSYLGCDSIVNTRLTVNPTYTSNNPVEICDGETYNIGSSSYTTGGTYTDILEAGNGCDSTVTTVLTVHPTEEETTEVTICADEVYYVGTSAYTVTGIYYDTVQTIHGCDRVLITDLTVNPLYDTPTETTIVNVCEGDAVLVGSNYYSTPGTYTDVISSVFGCDSTISTQIVILPLPEIQNPISICDGETYTVDTSTYALIEISVSYTEAGIYTDTIQATETSCKTVLVTNLTVNPVYENVQNNVTICQGETVTVGTSNYTTAGTYTDILETVDGCDSTVITNLTVNPVYENVQNNVTICQGETVTVGTSNYTTAGTYTDILETVDGCDSTVITNLTVNPVYENVQNNVTICQGETVTVGTSNYTTAGTYTDILETVDGCDSTVITNLTVNPVYENVQNNVTICQGEIVTVGTSNYTTAGTYTDILETVDGCDSTVITNLTVNPVYDNVQNDVTICQGETVTVGTSNYTTAGTYTDILETVDGCDSTVITNLTVNPVYENVQNNVTICQGETVTVGTSNYTTAGTYTDILETVDGCDSTVITNLTVNPVYENVQNNVMICQGETVTVGTSNYTTAGTYTDILETVDGCDSTVITNLTVNPVYENVQNNVTICQGETVTVGTSNYTTAGTYTDILETVDGCDSTVITNLTVNPVYENVQNNVTICQGETVTVGTSNYTTAGTYTDILETVDGCDSTVITNLTVNPVYENVQNNVTICQGETVTVGTSNYTTAGTYTDILETVDGCDSTVITNLTVNPVYENVQNNVTICQGETVTVGTSNYTTAGTYTDILETVDGCDSTVITNLTVNPVYENVQNNVTICQGEIVTVGTSNYTTAGTYTDILETVDGCDSTVITNLTVNPVYENVQNNVTICQGETVIVGTSNYTTAGTYTDILETVDGCDSTVITNLTVNPVYENIQNNVTICQGEAVTVGTSNYTTAGTYTDILETVDGCDSTVITNLTVNPVYENVQNNVTICQGETVTVGTSNYTTAGTYTDILETVDGCDSTVITNLTVNPVYENVQNNVTICQGETVTVGTSNYTTAGTYTDILETVDGCDSTVITNLTVNPVYENVQNNVTICQGETVTVGTSNYTTAGTYTDILETVDGCDSTVITNLTVNPVYDNVQNNVTICQGETVTVGTSNYTTAGTYTDILETVDGCDSTVITNLTVNPVYDNVQNEISICFGTSYTIGNSSYTIPGTYTDVLETINGCDSTVVTNLTIDSELVENHIIELCFGEAHTVGTSTYAISGNYADTLISVTGCDSIINTNLNIANEIVATDEVNLCFGEIHNIGTSTYNVGGTYTDVLEAANGCDSTVTTILTIADELTGSQTIELCYGETYTISTNTYNLSGTYIDTIGAVNSCDSIVTTVLTILPEDVATNEVSICDGETYEVGTSSYALAGTYADTLTNASGCDSIINTILTILPVSNETNDITICFGDDYTVGPNTYTVAGTYADTLTALSGCDSIINTNLSIESEILNDNVVSICAGESITVASSTYTIAGVYADTIASVSGCDSIINTTLTILDTYSETNDITICFGTDYTVGPNTYTVDGTYTDVLTAANGCDSTIVTNLTVLMEDVATSEASICEGETYEVGTSSYALAGTYADTLTNASGCDSIINTILTILPVSNETNDITICFGDDYTVGPNTYTVAGTYADTLTAASGCDSILNTILSVESEILNDNVVSICAGESITVASSTYTIAGVYADTIASVSGCDSIINTTLTILDTYSETNDITICFGTDYTVGPNTYTVDGTYTDVLTAANGCDSTIVTNLTVLMEDVATNEASICEGETYEVGTSSYALAGTYADTLTNASGCDSIINTILTILPVSNETNDITICFGDDYTVGPNTYTVAGTYADTLTALSGCDSIINTNLSIESEILNDNVVSICAGESITVASSTYTIAGVYADTIASVSGCDSIINTTLTILDTYSETNDITICFGTDYTVGPNTYTVDGTYTDVLTAANGCDSTIVTNLTVLMEDVATSEASICEGETYEVGTSSYALAGTYADTLTNASGCDSIINTILTILPVSNETNDITICFGDDYTVGPNTYTVAGTYADTLTAASGCDSILNTILSVESEILNDNVVSICAGESITIASSTYTIAGVYADTVASVSGCDSIINTTLTVLDTYNETNDITICFGDDYTVGSNTYTVDGTYTDVLTAANGCDSTIVTNLTVLGEDVATDEASICEGETYEVGTSSYALAGTYADTLTNASGCDSIINTVLAVLDSYNETNDVTICFGSVYTVGANSYTVAGTYADTLTTVSGCDSILNTILSVESEILNDNVLSICEGESVTVAGNVYYVAGVYADTVASVSGCDSIINTTLTVLDTYSETNDITICFGNDYTVGTNTYTTAGTYTDVLTAANGCDSTIVTNLSVLTEDVVTNEVSICDGETYEVGTSSYTVGGTYADTLTNASGCDSIINTILTVLPEVIINLNEEICEGESFTVNGEEYSLTGVYSDTLLATNGCDSIINLSLTVLNEIVLTNEVVLGYGDSITINGNTYTSDGIYNDTLVAVNGCDSIVITDLTILPENVTDNPVVICEGETYEIGTSSYSVTGNYTDTLTSTNGFDSIVNTALTVLPILEEAVEVELCEGESYEVGTTAEAIGGTVGTTETTPGTVTFEEAGTYTFVDSLITINGCDSIVTTTVEVDEVPETTNEVVLGYGDSITINGNTYTSDGIYNDTLVAVDGCDSIVITDLTILPENVTDNPVVICEGETYEIGTSSYSVTGSYTDTLIASNGFDSIVNTSLTVLPILEEAVAVELCEGESYEVGTTAEAIGSTTGTTETTVGTITFEESGTYTFIDSLTSINGCDSIVTTTVEVEEVPETTNEVVLGYGDSITINGNTYTSDGIYNDTLVAVNGCDSIVITDLTILPENVTDNPVVICEGETYEIGTSSYSVTGNYTDTLTSTNGFDSIVNTALTVLPILEEAMEVELCEGESYEVGTTAEAIGSTTGTTETTAGTITFEEAGTYTFIDSLTSINGCDSIVTTTVEVEEVPETTNEVILGYGDSITINGNTYTSDGIYNDTLVAVDGCDSIVITDLTILPENVTDNPVVICEGETYEIGTSSYSVTGSYTDTLIASNGFDSIVNTSLTVLPILEEAVAVELCEGESYEVGTTAEAIGSTTGTTETTAGTITFEESGTYTFIDSLTSINGCDSIVTTTVEVEEVPETTNEVVLGYGDSITINGNTYTSDGIYNDTLVAVNGCDSIVITDLTILPENGTDVEVILCEGESYTVGTSTYTQTGVYSDTLTAVSGFDSIITTTVTVVPEYLSDNTITICDGESYTVGNNTYTNTGLYADTLLTINGCDSIINTNLIILEIANEINDVTICFGDDITVGANIYDVTGTYVDVLTAANGCDSTVTTNLTVLPENIMDNALSICEGESHIVGTSTYTVSGVYADTLTATTGCDSIVNTTLTVVNTLTETQDISLCEGGSVTVGVNTYTVSGTYQDTLPSVGGCDSVIVTNLTINSNIIENVEASICEGESYTVGTSTYTVDGIYTDTLTSLTGCDSITNTTLTVLDMMSSTDDVTLCFGDDITVGANTYDATGTYVDVLTSANGCDSTVTTNLTVLPENIMDNALSICEGDSHTVGTSTYMVSGVYADTLTATTGCDSIINTTLTVVNTIMVDETVSLCNGESVTIGNNTYSTSGVYTNTFTTASGCDSIVTTTVVVSNVFNENVTASICEGETYSVGSSAYTVAGTYTDVLTSVAGCDSVVTTTLSVLPLSSSTNDITICFGDDISVGTSTYNASGTYTDVLTAVNGCDSTVTTNLTVLPENITNQTASICEGDNYIVGTSTYTMSGTYTDILTAVTGCDSIINTTVNVTSTIETSETIIVCEGESITIGNNTYSASGIYTNTFPSASGCDSIVTTTILVGPVFDETVDASICEGETYIVGTSSYTISGTYTDVLSSINGCDSIVNTNLTVLSNSTYSQDVSICYGDTFIVGTSEYTTGGLYTDVLVAANGCDSIVTTKLAVMLEDVHDVVVNICEGETHTVGTSNYTVSGVYTDTLTNIFGCDSIINTDLSVLTTLTSNETVYLCDGESVMVGNNTYYASGIYTNTLLSQAGCDSIVTTTVLVADTYNETVDAAICEGETYTVGTSNYTVTGTYTDVLTSVNGCDSIVNTNLTVHPLSNVLRSLNICEGETITVGTSEYFATGTYVDVLTSATGCDSIVTTNLTVNSSYDITDEYSLCFGETLTLNGTVVSTPGTYSNTYTTVAGCDSTVTTIVNFSDEITTYVTDYICGGEEKIIHGQMITEPGMYTDVYTSVGGCDSIVNVELILVDAYEYTFDYEVCEGEQLNINGNSYGPGSYTEEYQTAFGCDSTVHYNITALNAYELIDSIQLCDGDVAYYGGNAVYEEGWNTVNLQTELTGCDSIMNIFVSIITDGLLEVEGGEICEGSSIELVSNMDSGISWAPATGLSCTDCPNPIASPDETITYTATVVGCGGEMISATATVIVNQGPTVEIEADKDEIIAGESIDLLATAYPYAYEYTWMDQYGNVLCDDCREVTVSPTQTTTYTVIVSNVDGCTSEESVRINVLNDCSVGEIFIPNVISPNGDGKNDLFRIQYGNLLDIEVLRIYNRWGELIYETDDISVYWDGTFRGELLNPGVYTYYIKGLCLDGEGFLRTGNVTLLD